MFELHTTTSLILKRARDYPCTKIMSAIGEIPRDAIKDQFSHEYKRKQLQKLIKTQAIELE